MAKEEKKDVVPPSQTVETSDPFTPSQIAIVQKMMDDLKAQFLNSPERSQNNPNSPISMYGLRDPKTIETVKVSRFDAKWVLGFKNLQADPYKKLPKYLRYGVEPIRKLHNEPYVTLQLSTDGKNIEEKEVLLLDYMENREVQDIKVLDIKVESKINDHGLLGASGQFAVAVNDKGNPETRPTILAQSKSETRTFTVKLPMFDTEGNATDGFEYVFITDFLG